MDTFDLNKPAMLKKGCKPKPLESCQPRRTDSYKKSSPRHSRTKQLEVLTWIARVRIPLRQSIATTGLVRPCRAPPDDGLEPVEPGYRRPNYQEAAAFFKISSRTIGRWWRRRDDILQGNYRKHVNRRPECPELSN
ncbi:hypothetical protein GGS26DRAFT_226119 [Hypomontagnella submonticulosa]|nr:hypothetical protein GGS26DRAFT_226119 [Hypomontagnella submonticulosa]